MSLRFKLQQLWSIRPMLAMLFTFVAAGCSTLPSNDSAAFTSTSDLLIVAINNPQQLVASRAGSTLRGYDAYVPYNATTRVKAHAIAIAREYGMTQVGAWPIASLQLHCMVFRVAPGTQHDVLTKLGHDSRVALVQPLQTFETMSTAYNDPYFSMQQGFNAMDVADAHQWTRGEGIRIAVIDTGVDSNHPDLKGRIAEVRNFVDHDQKQFMRDIHGTEVVGIIAANPNNREGIVGVAPAVQLVALKACWQLTPTSAEARCNSFTLAQALGAAIDLQVQLVNLSISGPTDPLLDALIARGQQQGMIFIGAVSPNESPDGATNRFPISTPGVIAVDTAEHRTTVTNALPAPGQDILTLTPSGHYDFASGSSLATAHVTGTIALLLHQDNKLKRNAIDQLLKRSITTATNISNASSEIASTNRAVINACSALLELRRSGSCHDANASTISKATH